MTAHILHPGGLKVHTPYATLGAVSDNGVGRAKRTKGEPLMETKEAPTYARGLVRNYIGGKWVEGSTGKTFESRNPATGELLGVLTISDASDVSKAVEAADKAFKSWRLMPAPKRGEILFKAGQMLI